MFIESSQSQCKITLQIYFKMSQKINITFENKMFLSEVGYKQWPLAGEFSEFKYSPEISQFWRIRVLAKMAFFGNVSDSPDILQAVLRGISDSPRFAESHFCEKCDSPCQICASNSQFLRIWREWPLLRTHALRRGQEFSLTFSEEGFP
jgi:hypothetical protein